MLVTTILVTILSAASGVLAAPVNPSLDEATSPANLEKRDPQWDMNAEWRVACPSTRIHKWKGNLVNWRWCQEHCGCRTKFVKVWGECRTDKFLECYHNYCECYRQIGHINP